MKRYILLFIIVAFVSDFYAQSSTKNYIKETVYRTASNGGGGVVLNAPNDFENIIYFDGLGRPEQLIEKNASPDDQKNIVKHIEYVNNIGQTKDFLPFTTEGKTISSGGGGLFLTTYNGNFVDNANAATLNFYNTVENEFTQNPFSEAKHKNNLSKEVEEIAAPGVDWSMNSGHTVKVTAFSNTSNEVRRFTANANWNSSSRVYTNSLIDSGYFSENILTKQVFKDQNWIAGKNNTTEIYKGSDGRIYLKRAYNNDQILDTYYVYNNLEQLAYILTPQAIDSNLSLESLDELCFQYNYDANGLISEKKIPGKKWEYLVYDKGGRLALSGPNLNPFGTGEEGWLFIKYDYLNRMVYKGFYSGHTVNASNRAVLQGLIKEQTIHNEKRQNTVLTIDGVSLNYTNQVFPISSFTLLEASYYDTYGFANGPVTPENINGIPPNMNVKGLLTGVWMRNLTLASEKNGDLTYLAYDSKYRPIRVHTNNMLGGSTQVNNVFNFFGNATQVQTIHKRSSNSSPITIVENFTYNSREYLMKHTHAVNGQAEELMASYEYDGLGKLVRKNVGNTITKPLQKIDYKYNIRGWLKQINNPNNLNENSDNDLFGLTINYNTSDNLPASAKKLYNGNISSVEWKTSTDNIKRGYIYNYDALNRLTNATSLKNSILTEGFKEQVSYNKNGNILSMYRTAEIDGQIVPIDDALYNYNYNKLMAVTDATNHPQGINDFNKEGDDYVYDDFGNLVADKNRKITSISYNHLNQPVMMTYATGDKINFTYDSNGNRLKKTVTQGNVIDVVEYMEGYEYKNNELKYIATSEGFIKFESNYYNYVYQYKDHVGNVRVVYQDVNKNGSVENTEILNESNYYPFGLRHGYYNQIANNFSNSLLPNDGFNGQPHLVDLEANLSLMDFRMYDGALGRFLGIDLLADMFTDHSPYHFASNDPVSFMDPTGLHNEEGGHTDLEELVIETPPQVPPGGGFGTRPPGPIDNPFYGWTLQPTYGGGGGGGSSPFPDEVLDEIVIDVSRNQNQDLSEDTAESVGQPGDGESLIPIWGSGRSAVDHFQRGNYWRGAGYTVLAISDVFLVKSIGTIAVKGAAIGITKISASSLWRGGKTFAQYKAARGGTETLAKIATSTGMQRISTEFHHVFITQRMQRMHNLPNWLVNNKINVWKLNTVQHSLIDSYRYRFLRKGFKPKVGWFGEYNWFTKF